MSSIFSRDFVLTFHNHTPQTSLQLASPHLSQRHVSFVLQLFEELQELLTQDAKDQSPSQAPGLRRRAGSRAQGEGFQGAAFGGSVAQLSGSGTC